MMGYRELPLTNSDKVALVDDDYDGEWLSNYSWSYNPTLDNILANTPIDMGNGRIERALHRLAYGLTFLPTRNSWVTFKNGDKYDCRTSNLIVVTPREAMKKRGQSRRLPNLSGYRGVHIDKAGYITANFSHTYLQTSRGSISFLTPQQAARAYDKAAYEKYGDKAILNFPDEHGAGEGQVEPV